jgi:hypothetical protein
MSETNEKSQPFTWVWFIVVLFVYFMISVSLVSSTLMNDLMSKEVEMYVDVFGVDATNDIVENAQGKRQWLLIESGAYDGVRHLFLPKDFLLVGEVKDKKVFNTKFFTAVADFIDKAFHSLDLAILRFCALKPWLILSVLTISLGAYTGYFRREIKKNNFDYSSPFRRGISKKVIILTPLIFIVVFSIPLPITPMYVPFLVSIIGMAFLMFISNTIKRL